MERIGFQIGRHSFFWDWPEEGMRKFAWAWRPIGSRWTIWRIGPLNYHSADPRGHIDEAADEIERKGLEAAIRAAKLAMFVIKKQGVMPNSNWESGFNDDLKTAEDALLALTS